jgi:FlaG/FlaF family flagellin (archaellin)
MATVAIILSATIGAFVLSGGGDGATQEPAPTISTEIDRGPGYSGAGNTQINISHKGGDTVDVSDLEIITETQCFDTDTLVESEQSGTLVNLPIDPNKGVEPTNVNGDNIFQGGIGVIPAPLGSSTNSEWTAGERLEFEIDSDECNVPDRSLMRVDVIHKPSNSIIATELFGKTGFTPTPLKDEVSPPTAGATSSHTLVLKDIDYGTPGNGGDEVDEITVDYNPDNSGPAVDFNGITNSNVDVTMTRTLSSGPDRSSITLYSSGGGYTGSEATFNTNFFSQTDVAGPITLEMNGIKNPSSADTYDVDITLVGQGSAPTKTFTKTIEIEN